MSWVVDTSVILDIRIGHPRIEAEASATCLEQHATEGLVVCPITFIELAPNFDGDLAAQRSWLDSLAISSQEPWLESDTALCHALWDSAVQRKRHKQAPSGRHPDCGICVAVSRDNHTQLG